MNTFLSHISHIKSRSLYRLTSSKIYLLLSPPSIIDYAIITAKLILLHLIWPALQSAPERSLTKSHLMNLAPAYNTLMAFHSLWKGNVLHMTFTASIFTSDYLLKFSPLLLCTLQHPTVKFFDSPKCDKLCLKTECIVSLPITFFISIFKVFF